MSHYRFDNLLGAPYRGGNLCVRGTKLLNSIGNRVSEVDLTLSSSTTLPSENLTETRCIAVSPSGSHMISFDTDGRAILVNLRYVEKHVANKSRSMKDSFPQSRTAHRTPTVFLPRQTRKENPPKRAKRPHRPRRHPYRVLYSLLRSESRSDP